MRKRTQLIERREQLGFTQEELGDVVGVSSLTIRQWEGGKRPRPRNRARLAQALEVSPAELQQMLDEQSGPRLPSGHAVLPWMSHFESLEQRAACIQTLEPITMPGLLQTETYAEAQTDFFPEPLSEGEIEQRVSARMARQAVLEKGDESLEFQVVVDESVLYRQVGSPDVMLEQLAYLAFMARLPNIKIQIVPLRSGLLHAAWFGSFTLFLAAVDSAPFMLCRETMEGFGYQDNPLVIDEHAKLFQYLQLKAMSPVQSADFIQNIAEEYPL